MSLRISQGIDYTLNNSVSRTERALEEAQYNRYPSLKNRPAPNFPTPPVRSINFLSMPNDLVANDRNYYTEIFFVDYRTASSFGLGLRNAFFDLFGAGTSITGAIRLPIPLRINDQMSFKWGAFSATQQLAGAIDTLGGGAAQARSGIASSALSLLNNPLIGAATGKLLNPFLFMAFQQPDFRSFTFDWVLAPRTRQESATVKQIISIIKNAASPTSSFIMDYPLIAMVRMSPRNLNGHAIFHPMAITAINASYTPNPMPSFFEDTGAPTLISLSVSMTEIKIWSRGEIP